MPLGKLRKHFATLPRAFVRGSDIFRRHGFIGVGARLLRSRPESQPDAFDLTHGTDTCTRVDLWKLNIPRADWRAGVRYQPVSVEVFDNAISYLQIDPSQYTFIDLGSGKGRALILASKKGFRRVIGIEFSAELCAAARKNLAATGVTAEVICQSASEYVFPDEPAVVFLYNPFGPTVLKPVLTHLLSGTWIVYVNPEHISAIESLKFCLKYRTAGVAIWQTR